MVEDVLTSINEYFATMQMTKNFLTGEIFDNAQLTEILSGYKAGISNFAELNKMVRSHHKLSGSSQVQQENAFIADYIADSETRRILNFALSIYDNSIDDIISMGENSVVEFFEGIPTLDLESKLFALRNVQWNREITENDWADLRALVVAVPYCDIVVTERLWHSLLQRINVEKKYKTTVLKNVNELFELFNDS